MIGSVKKSVAGRVRHSVMKFFNEGGFSSTRGRKSGLDLIGLLVLLSKTKRVVLPYRPLCFLVTFLIPISSSLLALLSFMNTASDVITAVIIAAIQ